MGLFGPVATVVADAVSYLFSALGLTAIEGEAERPQRTGGSKAGASELLNGWRHILGHGGLRPLYLNNLLVGGLLADLTSTRTALAVAGLLVPTSPLLLPRRLGASLGAKVRPSRA